MGNVKVRLSLLFFLYILRSVRVHFQQRFGLFGVVVPFVSQQKKNNTMPCYMVRLIFSTVFIHFESEIITQPLANYAHKLCVVCMGALVRFVRLFVRDLFAYFCCVL